MSHTSPMLRVSHLSRNFTRGNESVRALDDVTLRIDRGEMIAIEGPSGAGKSTLLHLLGLLDRPDAGTIRLGDRPVHDLPESERTQLRLHHIGVVTQRIDLLTDLDAAENVAVPALLARGNRRPALRRAAELLDEVGLSDRVNHRPDQLSGGELQRVAIARALINGPELIIADEPTGSLDTHSGDGILALLRTLSRDGVTVILATHDVRASAQADRTIRLVDGKVPDTSERRDAM